MQESEYINACVLILVNAEIQREGAYNTVTPYYAGVASGRDQVV